MSAPWDEAEPVDDLGLMPDPAPFDDPADSAAVLPVEPPIEVDAVLLAGRVQELEGEIDSLTGEVRALVDTITDEKSGLDAVNEAIGAILDILSGQPGGPWLWDKLDPARQHELWIELGEWVGWFESRYLVGLPSMEYPFEECWYRHPVAVELLTALMVAHHATYSAKAVMPSFTLVEWHTRALDPVFAALRTMKVFTKCGDGHQDPSRATTFQTAAFEAWVEEVAPDPLAGSELQGDVA